MPAHVLSALFSAHKKLLLLAAIIVIGIFTIFRFSSLSSSPPGFFVDEASIGLNAVRILQTGKDEHGISFPLYFKAFGDYKNPIYVYSAVPLIWIFGPNQQSVRLASALWVFAAGGVFILLMHRGKSTIFVTTISTLLAVTNPWVVQLSRVAFEVASFPFFLFLAALFLYPLLQEKVSQKQVLWLALGFGLSLGALFYTYTAARLLSPMLLASGVILIFWKYRWKAALLAIFAWTVCLVPLLLSDSFQNGALLARYNVVGLQNETTGAWQFFSTAFLQYIEHFSPNFLRGGGDKNLRHTLAPFGIFLTSSLPFIAAGIYHSVWKQRSLFALWCLGGLLISPIPSALTTQSPHVLRSIGLLVFCLIFAWYGVAAWAQSKQMYWKILGSVGVWLVLIESLRLLTFTSQTFPQQAGPWFDADSVEAIEVALQHSGPYAFSQHLYPGSEATVSFLAEKWQVDINSQNTTYFDPNITYATQSGVIVGDGKSCARIIRSTVGVPQIFENGGACVLWFEP